MERSACYAAAAMRALVADLSTARAAWTAATLRVRHDAAWRRGGILRMEDIATPRLPGPGWTMIRPTAAGICGSDLKLLRVTGFSPLLTAYNPNVRAVLGHEVAGVVERAAAGTTGIAEGDRVLVEPTLWCRHKGLPECARCRAGEGHLCENLSRAGSLCAGQGIGFCVDVGGGWSDAVVAHADMLVPATRVPAQREVLAEPHAVALHAALRWRRNGDRVAVIGPGPIGLLVIASLRRLHPDLDISVVGAPSPQPRPFGTDQALAAGADRVWSVAPAQVLELAATHLGAHTLRPRLGRLPVLDGGLDAAFDCIATPTTIDLGLRLLRGRGTLVLVGTAGRHRVDWSLVWWRELSVVGSVVYGRETDGSRTMETVRDWLADPAHPVDMLVTHRYPLERWQEALETASLGPRAGAIKVVLEPAAR